MDDEEERLAAATSEASPEAPTLPAAAQEKETSDTSVAITADKKEATTEKGPPAVVEPSPMVINVTMPPSPAFDGPEPGMHILAALTSKNPKSFVSNGGKRIPFCIANRRFKKKRRPKQKDLKTMEMLGWLPYRHAGGSPPGKEEPKEVVATRNTARHAEALALLATTATAGEQGEELGGASEADGGPRRSLAAGDESGAGAAVARQEGGTAWAEAPGGRRISPSVAGLDGADRG
ncbi:unnamed protein product [Linum trigynum]|uniref:Uncharacterized protein n=1 Tax=Linum trigynum TaxID=586398 RepID=A0AAV2DTZ3_9ROSI